ncbi:hypothetical protein LZ190_21495, partial [Rhodovulum sulfidophilum]|nr:hypothetical protein [Rhodovulum sulfidophilum]
MRAVLMTVFPMMWAGRAVPGQIAQHQQDADVVKRGVDRFGERCATVEVTRCAFEDRRLSVGGAELAFMARQRRRP